MSKIKERIEKLYKTLGVTALMMASQSVNATPLENSNHDGGEAKLDSIEILANTINGLDSMTVAAYNEDAELSLKDIEIDSDFVFSAELLDSLKTGKIGKELVDNAKKAQRKVNDEIHCFRAVKEALNRTFKLKTKITGISAYMAADQLEKDENFVEIKCKKENLDKLPDGAIIVYGKGKSPVTVNGHIGVVGDCKDISSKIRNINKTNTKRDKATGKRVAYGGEPRVFLPADTTINANLYYSMINNDGNAGDNKMSYDLAMLTLRDTDNSR